MNKELVQKIIAGALFLGLLIYSYFNFLLGPLDSGMKETEAEIEEFEDKIQKAKAKIRLARSLEAKGVEAEEYLTAANEYFREGTPIAWFPPMIKAFFKRMGVDDIVVNNLNTQQYPGDALDNYVDLRWDIQLPETDFFTLGNLLAAIENEQPFARIEDLSISRSISDPQFQRVGLIISLANKKPES